MINRVVLMGRLVADPELKYTNSGGVAVTSFRIAVDRSYVKQGEQRQTDFFDIVAWRQTAEFVCRNFTKGALIAVDGQLQSRQYQNREGQNRTAIEVMADNVSFTGERRDAAPQQGYNNAPPANYGAPPQGYQQPAPNGGYQQGGYPQQGYQQPPQNYGTPQQGYQQQTFADMPMDDDLPF